MDDETSIPVSLSGFGWGEEAPVDPSELDANTLIESYQYTRIDFETVPDDSDFDETNPSYRFRR